MHLWIVRSRHLQQTHITGVMVLEQAAPDGSILEMLRECCFVAAFPFSFSYPCLISLSPSFNCMHQRLTFATYGSGGIFEGATRGVTSWENIFLVVSTSLLLGMSLLAYDKLLE